MGDLRFDDLQIVVIGALALAVWWRLNRRLDVVSAGGATATTVLVVTVLDLQPDLDHLRYGQLLPGVAAALIVLVGVATAVDRTRSDRGARREIGIVVLVALAASWSAVPLTTPLVAAAGVVGVTALALVAGADVEPFAAGAVVAMVPLAAACGAPHDALATAGTLAASGLLVWWPGGRLLALLAGRRGAIGAGAWVVVVHAGLALAAARWIAVAPDATWPRLAVVAAVGLVTGGIARPAPVRAGA